MRTELRGAVILRNIGWGIRWGIGYACVFSFIALVIYLFRGSRAAEAYNTTLGTILLAYFAGGLTAGAIVGILRPLGRRKWGAAVLGLIGAIPVYAAGGVAVFGWFSQWGGAEVFAAIATPLLGACPSNRTAKMEAFENAPERTICSFRVVRPPPKLGWNRQFWHYSDTLLVGPAVGIQMWKEAREEGAKSRGY